MSNNSEVYIQQLNKRNSEIQENWSELVSRQHHDTAVPRTSLTTPPKSKEFDWNVLLHPPYTPDFAPWDYYLRRLRKTFRTGKTENFVVNEYYKVYERELQPPPYKYDNKLLIIIHNVFVNKVLSSQGTIISSSVE